ncbi:MAG: CDC27 family protein [Sulfurovum sp.]|nr:CDC27 family protein [Sulfurovum sp.]
MYDIRHLEEEWNKYRKKKLRPWYIVGLSVIILSVSAVFFLNNEKVDLRKVYTYFKTSKDTLAFEEKSKDTLVSDKNKIKSTVLVDNALEMLELEDNVIDLDAMAVKKPLDILVDIPLLEDTEEPIDIEMPETRKKMHLEIIESTSVTAYKDVERRFLESHDIDDALFLAKSYYSKGDYKKAEYWALQTNKLDEDIEESLLIFVKSKIKLGKKNEAIAILEGYVKKSNSSEAKKLLYRIKNDKL